MELEPNSLDWNGNKLEHELELEDMKRTLVKLTRAIPAQALSWNFWELRIREKEKKWKSVQKTIFCWFLDLAGYFTGS